MKDGVESLASLFTVIQYFSLSFTLKSLILIIPKYCICREGELALPAQCQQKYIWIGATTTVNCGSGCMNLHTNANYTHSCCDSFA